MALALSCNQGMTGSVTTGGVAVPLPTPAFAQCTGTDAAATSCTSMTFVYSAGNAGNMIGTMTAFGCAGFTIATQGTNLCHVFY